MSVRHRLVAITTCLTAVVLATLAASPASAASSRLVTFGVQPGTASGPDGRPYFSYGVTPGASVFDHAAVLNYSDVPLTLRVYATDGLNTSAGGLTLLPAAQRPVDTGAWLSLGTHPVSVRVPARHSGRPGEVLVPFELAVPTKAAPGDHVGGIVASLNTLSTNAQGAKVRLDQRIASRVYVRVAGTLNPRLSVENVQATYQGTLDPVGRGSVVVTYSVRNTGNVKLAGHQRVDVSGLFGDTSAGALPDVGLLLPGGTETVTAVVPGVLPTLWRTATVTVTPMSPAAEADPALLQSSGSTHLVAVPWSALLILLLLLLGGGIGLWLRPRSRSQVGFPEEDKVPALTRQARPLRALGGRGVAGGVVALASLVLLAPAAHADTALPYSDPNAVGSIGLCDRAGHPVNHGNIHDKPFVWRAVSSVPAPAPYDANGRTATLFAFQPRVETAPGQWSGELVTASAKYSNPAHPMAQATALDESLADYLADFPTMLDGLVQLRIYLGAPGQPAYTLKYAATDLKVSGDTWTVARGASVPCTGGAAVSLEAVLPTVHPAAAATATPHATATASGAAASTASATPTVPLVAAAAQTGTVGQPAGDGHLVAAAVLIVLLSAAGGIATRAAIRKRSHAD